MELPGTHRLVAIPTAVSRDGAGRGPVAHSRPSPRHGPAQDEHKRQLERLRAELEAERLRAQELRRRFAAETRELKEAAERDRQLLAERLHSRWEQRQARELQRLRELNQQQRAVEIRQLLRSKEAELRKVQGMLLQQRDDAIPQARDLQQQLAKKLLRGDWSSSEARSKLHDVLSKLCWETNGKQAAHIHHLEDELLLQRRCFLKYVLEQFEGEQPTTGNEEARAKATAWHCLQNLLGTSAIEPCSLESLMASSSCDGEGQQKTHEGLKDTRLQEEGNSMEVLLEAVGQDLVPHCLDSLPQGRTGSGRSVAEVGVQTVGQQEDCLPGSTHSRLLEQNTHLQSALKDLERRYSVLQEENCLLRKGSCPEVREKWERLKQKTVKLSLISKQLQERARQLQNIACMINTWVPLPIQSSTEELCLTSFSQQRAGERGEPAGALLAQDKQDDLSEKAPEELQAQAAADEEGSSHVSTHSPTCEELQVAERNDRCQKPKEQHQQLFQELERLERERSNRIISRRHQAMPGVDKESIVLKATRKQPAELRPFIVPYSYDPFDGPNEWPGLEASSSCWTMFLRLWRCG
ncbi:hypothetical protein QYF61_016437 [Mycteria americana]|uniref:RIMB1/RIM3A-C-like N-terminal domain-containing protein n=1 Tax=Mycteria americana TaxID=33587 RepID=A0AAN7MHA4_MYCAM|nr:hypothetical protein QYF61_016437 [Mycteria americana]